MPESVHRHAARKGPDPLVAALRERRRALGLSVNDIANRTGYSRSAVLKWESGVRSPAPHALRAYAGAVEARVELVLVTPAPLTITDMLVGLRPSTRGERRAAIASLAGDGHPTGRIAAAVGCSPRTVQRHRRETVA